MPKKKNTTHSFVRLNGTNDTQNIVIDRHKPNEKMRCGGVEVKERCVLLHTRDQRLMYSHFEMPNMRESQHGHGLTLNHELNYKSVGFSITTK